MNSSDKGFADSGFADSGFAEGGFATRAIHAWQDPAPASGATIVPI